MLLLLFYYYYSLPAACFYDYFSSACYFNALNIVFTYIPHVLQLFPYVCYESHHTVFTTTSATAAVAATAAAAMAATATTAATTPCLLPATTADFNARRRIS